MISPRRCTILASVLALLSAFPARGFAQDGPAEAMVVNSAEDRSLPWTAPERFRIGPSVSGPSAFFRVFPWTISGDRDGLIYVLDVGNSVVRIFDQEGQFLKELGGKGGGPGEFERPVGLAVLEDGTLVIADIGKASLIHLDGDGNQLQQIRSNGKLGAIARVGRALLVSMALGTDVFRLDLVDHDGTTLNMVDLEEPGIVRYPDCPMSVPGRPFFAPVVNFSATGNRFALNSAPEYEISVFSGSERVQVIRRDIGPIRVRSRDALRSDQVQLGFRIAWGNNRCEISPQEVLDARGYAHQVSPIVGLSMRPNGQIWVKRRMELNGATLIDILSPSGQYLGTLPEGFPFPTAWQSENQFLVYGVSLFGIPYVVAEEVDEIAP